MNSEYHYDLIVIGGGIHGVGVAADACGRGLSVYLCEQNDLASGTSSASSKLIHGGLRYLENYHFGLVRESLQEREILLNTAPHLVKPMTFIVPFNKQRRSFWLLRLGLFCYDLLSFSKHFVRSKIVYFNPNQVTNPLKRNLRKGFTYSDAVVDDSRLVITTALRAARAGCKIATQTKCLKAKRLDDAWEVTLLNQLTQEISVLKSKAVVNAAGPWIDDVIKNVFNSDSQFHSRLVKGSHIIVPKIYPQDEAYVLQHVDGRIVFVVPYCKQFTMIGTTDVNFNGSLTDIKILPQEIEYLCDIVSDYFHHPLKPQDVYASWAGIRPLVDDGELTLSSVTREYKLELSTSFQDSLPLVNIFGGKLTTYRKLSEKVLNLLEPFFPDCGSNWTAKQPLPGGAFPENCFAPFLEKLVDDYAWLPSALTLRLAHSYGTLIYSILDNAKKIEDLGHHFGHDLYEKEVVYLIEKEWAKNAQDILWRRTKLGLFLSPTQQNELRIWVENYHPSYSDLPQKSNLG